LEEKVMKTAFIRIVDGKFVENYMLGTIDATHVFMRRFEGFEKPSEAQIQQSWIYHIAQLKGMAEGLYEAVNEWLHGQRNLDNTAFAIQE
jgi:hypothetical protein